MDIADCYRLLKLNPEASFAEIKASYRRLAQQYHPDLNPGDKQAEERFTALTQAYKILVGVVQQEKGQPTEPDFHAIQQPLATKITRKEKPSQPTPPLSEADKQLKWRSYNQLQQLLRKQQFPQAIALMESLAQRLPQDLEVSSWQASAYQGWGRQLVNAGQLDKARIYLKKALKTDPHNRSLWFEVERDFRRIEQVF